MASSHILLDCGSGGKASQRLIQECFFKHFSNPILDVMDDAARLEIAGPIAMSTDSYTVTPLFFPGGSIGTLAVHGTVNDVSMLGAQPRYLSCAFIIEEGLPFADLETVVQDMASAAHEAKVLIVTGDTKVVPRGACDKLFINTTGIGTILTSPSPSGHSAQDGDAVLVSGPMGDHGLTIMLQREGLTFDSDVCSDSAPLNTLTTRLLQEIGDIHVLRDPTRGGLATTLNEIAEQSQHVIHIRESAIPVSESVKNGCSFLGLDPLYLANEGKLICILPAAKAESALALLRSEKYGTNAAIIGHVQTAGKGPARAGQVVLETPLGGKRLLTMLEGAQLPRIC
ncbi:MAG: hydrogenase expression/formation protein HypE [Desulfovibrionaceae bacterium]